MLCFSKVVVRCHWNGRRVFLFFLVCLMGTFQYFACLAPNFRCEVMGVYQSWMFVTVDWALKFHFCQNFITHTGIQYKHHIPFSKMFWPSNSYRNILFQQNQQVGISKDQRNGNNNTKTVPTLTFCKLSTFFFKALHRMKTFKSLVSLLHIVLAMRGQTSFYVECDGFSAAADAPHRGVEMFLEDQMQLPKNCVESKKQIQRWLGNWKNVTRLKSRLQVLLLAQRRGMLSS